MHQCILHQRLLPQRHTCPNSIPLHRLRLVVWDDDSPACLRSLTLSLGLALTCRAWTQPLQCPASMDPLRDPLHDSVLDEALADPGTAGTEEATAMAETTGASVEETAASSDGESQEGSVYSSLTAALAADEAAEPVPFDPTAPPAGPPRLLHSCQHHRPWLRSTPGMPFVSASPRLGPADYLRGLPIEIQDAESTLFRDNAAVDTGNGGEDAEPGENAESEEHEHDSPLSPPDGDDAGDGGDAGASGTSWVGPRASSSSRPRPRSSSRSRSPRGASGGPGTSLLSSGNQAETVAELDSGDPLHMTHQVTADTALANPRPGDWVYEAEGVSFNLTAAQRCLDETRRTVAALREGNRHRRSDAPGPGSEEPASGSRRPSSPRSSSSPGTASRSRSGRRRRTPPANRWGGWKTQQGCKLTQLPLAGTVSSRLRRCSAAHTHTKVNQRPVCPQHLVQSQCSKHRPRWWSPVLALPDCSADHPLTGVGPATLPSMCAENVRLSLQLPALLSTLCWCVGCATLALGLLLKVLACMHQHLGLTHRYRCPACPASRVPVAREAWSGCLWSPLWSTPCLAHRLGEEVPPGLQALDTVLLVVHSSVASFSPSLHPGPDKAARPFTTAKSRPGPKSRGLSIRCMQHLIILLCLHPACAGSQAEARVAAHATRAAGGICPTVPCLPASMPKPGGFPTSVKTRQPLNVPNTRSAKRAFQRACNRATRYGHTQYRGRTFTSAQVPLDRRQAVPTPCFPRARKHTPPEGLTVLSWNAGGLGGGVYDEVMTHLSASNIDIAVIQESKWSECMEYTSGAWSCIHSGCKTHKHAGILVAVHSRVALPSQLRFEHYLKGRLLHVRVPLQTSDSRHLHVIAIYQKTHVVSDKNTPVQRQQAWQALHKCLSRVPARDSIVLTGDFNTPLASLPPHVGPFVGAPLSHPPDDVSTLEVLMQTFRLTALNTWYPNPGGVHTFSFGKAKSQIDYIMVRLSEASTSARQV